MSPERRKQQSEEMARAIIDAERIVDQCAVRDFAVAMNDKLEQKRAEGRGGWHDPKRCTISELRKMLAEHVEKGDMVDIANFAMMIWSRERNQS